jgi:hypothetical protein
MQRRFAALAVEDPFGQAANIVDGNLDPGARLRQARHADGQFQQLSQC